MLPPGTLVNAIRSALAFVILLECFASFLSLATPDEMPKADKATIKITERRKFLGFMIQVRLIREYQSGANRKSSARVVTGGAKAQKSPQLLPAVLDGSSCALQPIAHLPQSVLPLLCELYKESGFSG